MFVVFDAKAAELIGVPDPKKVSRREAIRQLNEEVILIRFQACQPKFAD
jgi:hypothetical protein